MAAPPGTCCFFVEKKKRFCKMVVGKGKRFCGEHATMESSSSRTVCPLDPRHTVAAERLGQHLKKCNSRDKPKPVYYVENVNAGDDEDETEPQVSLGEVSRSELESLVDKLKTAAEGLQWDVEDRVLSHPVFQDELRNPKNGGSAHKHLKQQSSILGHLAELDLLRRGRCFVEFGAGRGKLSHWIYEALKPCGDPDSGDDLQLLLVERCSTRFKVDGKHQGGPVRFQRLQVDIQHLDLSKARPQQYQNLPVVGVGKHLCGAATDLALRCLFGRPGPRTETERPAKPPGPGADPETVTGPDLVLGLAVALCCHHRCEWRHYTGQQFFLQRGLGPADFSAFCRMSSWATCGLRPTSRDGPLLDPDDRRRDEEEHEPVEEADAENGFLSPAERQWVGRLCKLLIDAGRRHFLQTRGFASRLSHYVDLDLTLENVLLTAVPSSPGPDPAPGPGPGPDPAPGPGPGERPAD